MKCATSLGKPNICFDCKRACGGCSWTELNPDTLRPKFEPVAGWEAKETVINMGGNHHLKVTSYHITSCPLFEKDEDRAEGCRIGLSVETLRMFMKLWGEGD